MIWLVERLWIDPLENREAYGYDLVGYVTSEEEVEKVLQLERVPKSLYPWPLKYHDEPGDSVNRYRVTKLKEFTV